MRKQTYWGLGVLVLLIIIGACYMMITKPSVQEPENITYKGETFPIQEFYNSTSKKIWEEKVPMLRHIIAEAPNSEIAYYARRDIVTHVDENSITTHEFLFERLKPLLKYHPNSSNLLLDLLTYGRSTDLEAAIRYGKKALKIVDRDNKNSHYNAEPARIHQILGYAYEEIGDYDTAVGHYRQAMKLYKAKPDDIWSVGISPNASIYRHIEQIRKGNPILGPLSDGTLSMTPKASQHIFEPYPPTSLTATAGSTPGSVILTWRAPKNADEKNVTDYLVKYVKHENTKRGFWTDWISTGSTNTSYTVTGLDSGGFYEFRVAATNGNINSEPSKSAEIYAP